MSISTGFERPSINLLRMFQDALKSVEIGSLQVQDHLLQEQSHTHTDGSVLNSVNIDLGSADYGTDVQIIGDIDDLQKMSHRNSSLGEQALSAWRDCDKYWPLNRNYSSQFFTSTLPPRITQSKVSNAAVNILYLGALSLGVFMLQRLSTRFGRSKESPSLVENDVSTVIQLFLLLLLFFSSATGVFQVRERAGDLWQRPILLCGAAGGLLHSRTNGSSVAQACLQVFPPWISGALVTSWLCHEIFLNPRFTYAQDLVFPPCIPTASYPKLDTTDKLDSVAPPRTEALSKATSTMGNSSPLWSHASASAERKDASVESAWGSKDEDDLNFSSFDSPSTTMNDT